MQYYAEGCSVDAFSKDWSHEKFYAFSPFPVLPKILTKIENENRSCILIVPLFTTQPWFPRTLRILITKKSLFTLFSIKEKENTNHA